LIPESLPPRRRRHPEDIRAGVAVAVLQRLRLLGWIVGKVQLGGRVGKQSCDHASPLLKGIGDVLEKNQPEYQMLVLCRIHLGAQLVRRLP